MEEKSFYFVLPYPNDISQSNESNHFASDGWSIETIDEKLFFCCSDPGHGGAPIKIEVTKKDLDYAKNNNPTWNQICLYLRDSGYWNN